MEHDHDHSNDDGEPSYDSGDSSDDSGDYKDDGGDSHGHHHKRAAEGPRVICHEMKWER